MMKDPYTGTHTLTCKDIESNSRFFIIRLNILYRTVSRSTSFSRYKIPNLSIHIHKLRIPTTMFHRIQSLSKRVKTSDRQVFSSTDVPVTNQGLAKPWSLPKMPSVKKVSEPGDLHPSPKSYFDKVEPSSP